MLKSKKKNIAAKNDYSSLITNITGLLEGARKYSARAVNSILTSVYWLIGRMIVEYEYRGMDRTEYYGDQLYKKLSIDLTSRFGKSNIFLMKNFYLSYTDIFQTPSGKSPALPNIFQSLSGKSLIDEKISQTPSG